MIMVTILYIAMGMMGSFLFGYKVQVDVFQNINESGHVFLDIILESTFIVILAMHVPYIFYAVKETLLVMWDETDRRSISADLEVRKSLRSLGKESFMSSSDLAYKDMNPTEYNILTIGSFVIIIVASIFMEDIGLVFTLCSAVSSTCLTFLFPGFFYLIAKHKFGEGYWKIAESKFVKLAKVFVVMGVIMFTI